MKMKFTSRGYRLGPFTVPVDEEVESQLLKFIQQPPGEEGLGFSLIHYTIFHYFFSARYKIENLQKWCKYVTYFICVKFWFFFKNKDPIVNNTYIDSSNCSIWEVKVIAKKEKTKSS